MKNIFVLLTALLLLGAVAQAQIPSGAVLYLPFTGNANDASGNANNGTINGGVTLTADRFGNANSAYLFNGSTGYIRLNYIGAYLTDDLTISLWFKNTGNGTAGAATWSFISQDGLLDPDPRFKYNIRVNNPAVAGNSRAQGTFGCGACSTAGLVEGSSNTQDGNWHHLVVTFQEATHQMFLYLDGALQGSGTTIAPHTLFNASDPIDIGRWSGGGFNFGGAIDDIRIYNSVLNSTQANSLYIEGTSAVPTLSEWGLIILSLLSLSVLAAVVFMLNGQASLVPAGTSASAIPVAFVRSMPLNLNLLAKVLLYLLPLTVAGFIAVHYFIGTNGALDFTGTLVSMVIVGYIVHLVAGRKEQ